MDKRTQRRWKRAEDWWWKQTGWCRLGHLLRGVSCADLQNEIFSLDITTRGKVPKWFEQEMIDAEVHAGSRVAVVAIHPVGASMKRGFVVMRVEDFLSLHVGEKDGGSKEISQ